MASATRDGWHAGVQLGRRWVETQQQGGGAVAGAGGASGWRRRGRGVAVQRRGGATAVGFHWRGVRVLTA